jgi:hypothetical protein
MKALAYLHALMFSPANYLRFLATFLMLSVAGLSHAQIVKSELLNGDFSIPLDGNWTIFGNQPRWDGPDGGRMVFNCTGQAGSSGGVWQMLSVVPGQVYVFRADALPLEKFGGARGQLSIEWKNAAGEEIERTWGPSWDDPVVFNGRPLQEMTATAPEGASTASFVITVFEGNAGGKGGFKIDNVEVVSR